MTMLILAIIVGVITGTVTGSLEVSDLIKSFRQENGLSISSPFVEKS
jgi:hypothetical protein